MRVEIIAVGSELLLGQITNTNAAFISARLAEIGADVYYHTVVGDNPVRLKEAIKIAEKRADVLIFSGGLGPTKDDMTKETIAAHIDLELVSDHDALTYIEQYFIRSKRIMTDNNKKQALVFKGSTILNNRTGMAPGMAVEKNGKHYILVPGPPHEMEPMIVDEAIPYLLKQSGEREIITSHVLKFYGIGEAELEHRIQPLLDKQTNPTIAPLATADAVTLRITAKAPTIEEAHKMIAPIEQEIRAIVGEFIFGTDKDTLSSKALELLQKHDFTIAAAESLTAGLFIAELAKEPGVSAALAGGLVVYNEEAKVKQLGVDQKLLDEHGVVSSECAASLALKVQEKFQTNIGIGITGAAGPTPHDGEPAGTVWIGIALPDQVPTTFKLLLSGSRNANRQRTARFAMYYLIKLLTESIS
ncbi:competence/damage-inducible protein A [Sporosarcina ureilytica]|uniref:Putative competence-damage inducible protein n=1 Tax=Sporosarcina ureilytica TaxID=298596 RepID=A0A1D8JHL3_9BACL|nr:competence/damage-inducible protein A [Sporosarcina ureilytica]AOV08210.1 competence/damage-inducible protein A [Sporosarcina ureilytica]